MKKVEASLRRHDWSLVSPVFNLAICCLRRDWDNLDELTRKAKGDDLQRTEALTWSIFREARDREEFKRHFLSNTINKINRPGEIGVLDAVAETNSEKTAGDD